MAGPGTAAWWGGGFQTVRVTAPTPTALQGISKPRPRTGSREGDPRPSIRMASSVVLRCWKALHWRPRIAATWGFNPGWAQEFVARSPKRGIINISKTGPSVRLRFPLRPRPFPKKVSYDCLHNKGLCSRGFTEMFLTVSAYLSQPLSLTESQALCLTLRASRMQIYHQTKSRNHGARCGLQPVSPRWSCFPQKSLPWACILSYN